VRFYFNSIQFSFHGTRLIAPQRFLAHTFPAANGSMNPPGNNRVLVGMVSRFRVTFQSHSIVETLMSLSDAEATVRSLLSLNREDDPSSAGDNEEIFRLALGVVDVAAQYRSFNEKISAERKILQSQWDTEFSANVTKFQQAIGAALAADQDLYPYFREYRSMISQSYIRLDAHLADTALTQAQAEILRRFEKAIESLSVMLSFVSREVPWQLSYACEKDPLAAPSNTSTDGTKVDFGGKLVNADGSIIFEDSCGVCSLKIQEGLLYGKGTPRMHCLDCNGPNATVCAFCFKVLNCARYIGPNVAQLCPHLSHRIVEENNESVVLRVALFHNQLSLPHLINNVFTSYANRPCFGSMVVDSAGSGSFQYSTYQEEYKNRILPVSQSLMAAIPDCKQRIAVSVQDSRLFYDLEIAILLGRYACVGIPQCWSITDWIHIAARAEVVALFIDPAHWEAVGRNSLFDSVSSLRLVVLTDDHLQSVLKPTSASVSDSAIPADRRVILYAQFLCEFASVPTEWPLPGQPDDETFIMHTSGSTGVPKGIIQVSKVTLHDIDVAAFTKPNVEFSYLPPYWGADKLTVWRCIFNGGCVALRDHRNGLSLFKQLTLVRPSALIVMPAIVSELKCEYLSVFDTERQRLQQNESIPASTVEVVAQAIACAEVGRIIGDRCRMVGIGGARVPDDLLTFLRTITPAHVVDAYGTSESSGISSNNKIASGISVILLDRPDLGYTTKDLPYPRGEICVRNEIDQVPLQRWLCSDAERDELQLRYLDNGYFRTGDLGAMPTPTTLVVLGRASSLIKLSCGIVVNPEKTEDCLASLPGISQVVIVPTDVAENLVAIVVPEPTSSVMEPELLSRMREFGKGRGLQLHELPAGVILEKQKWTSENGCLLPNKKLNRHKIRSIHRARLCEDFAGQLTGAAGDHCTATDVKARLVQLVAGVLARPVHELDLDLPLVNCGLTSMAAVQLTNAINQLTHHVPGAPRLSMTEVLASSMASLLLATSGAEHSHARPQDSECPAGVVIESREASPPSSTSDESSPPRTGGSADPDFMNGYINHLLEQIYRSNNSESCPPQLEHQDDSNLNSLLVARGTGIKYLLLTGVTGYFGKFLAASLLSKLVSGKEQSENWEYGGVICLVRAKDSSIGLNRLKQALLSTTLLNEEVIDTLCGDGKLLIVVGDLANRFVGLRNVSQLLELSSCIGMIVHAAAEVKMFDANAGVPLLLGPNVVATANLLELAHLNPGIEFCYISTLSCSTSNIQSADGTSLIEDKVRETSTAGATPAINSDAYTVTKHMSEVLIRRYYQKFRTECKNQHRILRLPLLTWSAEGVANEEDWLVRLLSTCRRLDLYPECSQVPSWRRPVAFLPVDVCAHTVSQWLTQNYGNFESSPVVSREGAPFQELRSMSLLVCDVINSAKMQRQSRVVHDFHFLTAVSESILPFSPLAKTLRQEIEPGIVVTRADTAADHTNHWSVGMHRWLGETDPSAFQ
jgi:long-subunit acyl-CoA synthetase (AMP-forming)/thioester reductase-like protein